MKLKSVLQFEKRHRQPDGDANTKWASETDGDNVLLDRHGKPVLDKDGNPVFVDRQLGRRPLLNNDSAKDGGLRLPTEETAPVSDDPDAGLPDVTGYEEPEDGLGRLPDEADFFRGDSELGELPPEEDPAPHPMDRLALLLETADDE